MKEKQNIEKLLQEKFNSFEPIVPDAVWANVSSSAGIKGTFLSTLTGKLVVLVGLIAAGTTGWYFLGNTNTNKAEQQRLENNVKTKLVETIDEESLDARSNENFQLESEIIAVEKNTNWDNEKAPDQEIQLKEVKEYVSLEETEGSSNGSVANLHITTKRKIIHLEDYETISESGTEKKPKEEEVEIVQDSETIVVRKIEEDELFATIIPSAVGGYAPLEVTFDHHSSEGTLDWDFGDGSTSFSKQPIHTFEKVGTYIVSLTVTTEQGKQKRHQVEIEVMQPSSMLIPNTFTPNGDGINDHFLIRTEGIKEFSLTVADLNLKTIFESNAPQINWDGNDSYGEPLPNGKYIAIVRAIGTDGKIYRKQQVVILKR